VSSCQRLLGHENGSDVRSLIPSWAAGKRLGELPLARRARSAGAPAVAICNRGVPGNSDLFAVVRPLRELQAPRPASPPPPALGEPASPRG
jgi:hypothetical protein